MVLSLSSICLAVVAIIFGVFGGEWRAAAFLGFAALGFRLGAQELQSP